MFEDNGLTTKYDKFTHHIMIHEIILDHCFICYAETVNTISGRLSHEYEIDISQ